MSEPKPKEATAEKVLVKKWGQAAISAGFTALPDVIFKCQKQLELKATDVLVILHLNSYWWKPNDFPWPSKATLAAHMGVDPSTIRRSIKSMEQKGYIRRIYRKASVGDNQTNVYDLKGLVAAVDKIAREELERREKTAANNKQRAATPKSFALIEGGKAD